MATKRKAFKSAGRVARWLDVDTRDFDRAMEELPRTYALAQKIVMRRVGFKFRKEAHGKIDRGTWEKRKVNIKENGTSKKIDIKLAMKSLVRFKVTESNTKKHGPTFVTRMGIFPGTVRAQGRAKGGTRKVSTLKNDHFVFKYGVQVARFGQVFTYGGRLPVLGDIQRKALHELGLHIGAGRNHIYFAKRDWTKGLRMFTANGIQKYIHKVFLETFQQVRKSQIKAGNIEVDADGGLTELPVAKGFRGGMSDAIEVQDKELSWIMNAKDIEKADFGITAGHKYDNKKINDMFVDYKKDSGAANREWRRNPSF